MNRKKVLYFMPDNPMKGHAGNISRCRQMLSFFNERDSIFETDFVSEQIWGDWDQESEIKFQQKYPKVGLELIQRKIKRDNLLGYLFRYKIPNFLHRLFYQNRIDLTTLLMHQTFRKVLSKKKYDIVIISYAQWGTLIKNLPYRAYTINDTHDFISLQKESDLDHPAKSGKNLRDEFRILKTFDCIWTFSVEEQFMFSQVVNNPVRLIPIGYPAYPQPVDRSFQYDLIYVASNNPHNIKGINWFIKEVLPLLKDIRIAVIGKIAQHIPDHPSIHKLGFVDDLEETYQSSKVSICPMLSGTGIKIKVLESLSMGIPVVTNSYGVTGLVNKINNGCLVSDEPHEFAGHIQKLLENEPFRQANAQQGQELMKSFYNLAQEEKVLIDSLLDPFNKK